MVERKYREGLNKEMERLRSALPGLTATIGKRGSTAAKSSCATEDDDEDEDNEDEDDDGDGMLIPGKQHVGGAGNRPSKAVVLQTAVEEIEMLRRERARLEEEVERAERERDKWKREVEMLKGSDGRGGRGMRPMGMG
jgi:hypothetical protein